MICDSTPYLGSKAELTLLGFEGGKVELASELVEVKKARIEHNKIRSCLQNAPVSASRRRNGSGMNVLSLDTKESICLEDLLRNGNYVDIHNGKKREVLGAKEHETFQTFIMKKRRGHEAIKNSAMRVNEDIPFSSKFLFFFLKKKHTNFTSYEFLLNYGFYRFRSWIRYDI